MSPHLRPRPVPTTRRPSRAPARRPRRAAGVLATGTLIALTAGALAACADRVAGPGTLTPRRDLTATEQLTVGASNRFALDLFRTLGAGDDVRGRNLVVSPYSGVASLGMALNGAGGTTLAGMQQALGLAGQPVAASNATFHTLTTYLLGADPAVTVRSANSVWTMTGVPIRPEFSATLQANFDADARSVTFGSPDATRAINAWANAKTNGLIPSVFDPGQPDASTVALLVNALYFKGSWTQRFDVGQTASRAFHLADGTTVPVPTMSHADVPLRVGGDGSVQVGELAYGGGAYVMTIVVPASGSGVDALAATLTPARWDSLTAALHDARLTVALPKFTLQSATVWNSALEQLGMTDAFTPDVADFSALSATCMPAGTGDCHISEVRQHVYIRVDEDGTEAASVTSTGVGVTSLPTPFVVDRPFLFAVRERKSGAILFLGRVLDPRG